MQFPTRLAHLALSLFLAGTVSAASYYVDYANGDNAADGLSPQTAWQHSPGDQQASDHPSRTTLQAGDIIRFKGGVTYTGEIKLGVSGSEPAPIILDGNTDGSYGEGRAILDGARTITNWQPVPSPDFVADNPRWQEIMYADIDVDLASNFSQGDFVPHRDAKQHLQAPWQRIFLIDGERRILPIAQSPKPTDPFYPDLPADFYESPMPLTSSYPHKIYYEEGSKGNGSLPLIAITYGGNAPVIEPVNGGAISVEMNEPATITEIGLTLFRPQPATAPEQLVFLAEDVEVYQAELDPTQTAMQRFKLPHSVDAHKLTFQLRHSGADAPKWTKLQQIAAFTADGTNVIQHEVSSALVDEERFTQPAPNAYDDMFIGVHGGNNHVYFGRVQGYAPDSHQLKLPHFTSSTYDTTKYALYNSPKFINLPGEWCLRPLDGGRTRVFLLPEHLENGKPSNIGFPELKTAISLSASTSHVEVRGFLMQRYSGGYGGVATHGNRATRPAHIRIVDCEIRFMSGQSGISLNHSDDITVENCTIHHCPGWTVGIYVNRIQGYQLLGNRLDTNSGSGIRHYESSKGVLKNNYVLNHYGMHSSGVNFYEGCEDILFESNYVHNVITINRSAENLTFRNNIIDSEGRSAINVALWRSGRFGDKSIKNLLFENNTFVNTDREANWSTSIFVQSGASQPEGLVIRNNILDRLRAPIPATLENNIFVIEPDASVAGTGSLVEEPTKLFVAPEQGDFRRQPASPMMEAGADMAPPSLTPCSR